MNSSSDIELLLHRVETTGGAAANPAYKNPITGIAVWLRPSRKRPFFFDREYLE
jgi:hypothetical protein